MTEDTFVRELGRRAEDVHGTPLTLEDVRGKAHGIQRRRRVVGTVVAAVAIAAVVVPATLLSGGRSETAPDPAVPPAHGRGAAILHDRVVTMADGSTVPVDVDSTAVSAFSVLSDGRILVARSDLMAIQVLSASGRPAAEYPIAMTALTMGPTDETAAWIDANDEVQVLESGAAEPVAVGTAPTTRFTSYLVEAVIGDHCAEGGCQVLVGDGTTTQELTPTGPQDLGAPEPFRVSDVSPTGGLWSVIFPPASDNEQFGCVGLYDPESQEVTARNCDTSNLTFGPDGQHLIGTRGDNNMAGKVTILDLDLQVTGEYSPKPNVVSRAAWSDPTHVLAVIAGLKDNEWSVVQVGLDGGSAAVVDGPIAGQNPEFGPEFVPSQ